MNKKTISIILPAYNEVGRIVTNAYIVGREIYSLEYNTEIIIVDNLSTDGTYETLLENFSNKAGYKVVQSKERGKGSAIRSGIEVATGDYIVFLDADLDIYPSQIKLLFDVMKVEKADVVIGSKMHPNSIINYPLYRRIISLWYYYFIVKLLFGLKCHDTQTGIKLFKASVLKEINFEENRFVYDLEVLVRLNQKNYVIAEAPVVLQFQRGFGRTGAGQAIDILKDTFKLYWKLRREKKCKKG